MSRVAVSCPFVTSRRTGCPGTAAPTVSRTSNSSGCVGRAPTAACWPMPSTKPVRTPEIGARGTGGAAGVATIVEVGAVPRARGEAQAVATDQGSQLVCGQGDAREQTDEVGLAQVLAAL